MNKIIVSTLSLALLSACGGGGKGDKDPVTPVATGVISGISGLGYKTFLADNTEKNSGVINADNEFIFEDQAAKTITLYLGGAEIATATANSTMSLMDFFPDLPTSEKAFRTSLRKPEFTQELLQSSSRAQGIVNSQGSTNALYKASNIMRLLVALDNDNNPDNGLDLLTNDWQTQLTNESGETLNFTDNMFNFESSQAMLAFQEKYDVSISMDPATPLATLYELTNTLLLAHRRNGYTTPTITPRSTVTYEYDAQQRLTKETIVGNGTTVKTYSYDDNGNINTNARSTFDGNNVLTSSTEETYKYNSFGKKIRVTEDRNTDPSNSEFTRVVTEYSYLNDRVYMTKQYTKQDDTGDNSFEWFSTRSYAFNENNQKISETHEDVDQNGDRLELNYIYSYEYNGNNKISQQIFKHDYSGDTPIIDTAAFAYATNSITRTEQSGNYTEVITETFNDAGQILTKTRSEKTNDYLNGQGDITYTYDDSGRLTSCTTQKDTNGDASIDFALRIINSYNDSGLASITRESDYDNDGIFDADSERSANYGDNGELMNEDVYSRYFSYDAEAISEGVRYLIHEYLFVDRDILYTKNSNVCYLDV